MELDAIITLITFIVTLVCGFIAKKVEWFSNKLIPIQNLAIGIIAGIVYFAITKDINLVIMAVGLGAGGTYDIISNVNKLTKGE